jgi:hypothetical protein
MKFRISFSISAKHASWDFERDSIEFVEQLDDMDIKQY